MRKAGSGMRRSGTGSGGGVGSNKVVHPGVRVGAKSSDAMSPSGVAQQGNSQGGRTSGEGHHSSMNTAVALREGSVRNPTPFGNAVAASTPARPGGGRTVMKSGSQGTHGPVDPGRSHQMRDILSEYGKDAPGKRQ
jgi:hypothetical protein